MKGSSTDIVCVAKDILNVALQDDGFPISSRHSFDNSAKDAPFTVKESLPYSRKNRPSIYIVYVVGGELGVGLQQVSKFPKSAIRVC